MDEIYIKEQSDDKIVVVIEEGIEVHIPESGEVQAVYDESIYKEDYVIKAVENFLNGLIDFVKKPKKES